MPNGDLRYRRGEIWWVNLDPTVGSETAKKRPCVILQNDVGNARSDTTMVAPLLKGSKAYPFVVSVEATAENGLEGFTSNKCGLWTIGESLTLGLP
jgi:mRNA interferase MazF